MMRHSHQGSAPLYKSNIFFDVVILISQNHIFFIDLLRSTALTGQSWLDLDLVMLTNKKYISGSDWKLSIAF